MRYFLDTEFDENGETIMPISLALVREDGRFLYAELPFDFSRARENDFVRENVLPHLIRANSLDSLVLVIEGFDQDLHDLEPSAIDHELVDVFSQRLLAFVGKDPVPEFWAYYADYDWVLWCRLFGKMADLPSHFPKLCMDLQQWYRQMGEPPNVKPSPPRDAHHALADAQWNLTFHASLSRHAAQVASGSASPSSAHLPGAPSKGR